MNSLTKLSELSGVGPKRTALYEKLGLFTVGDLLYYYPRDYIDFTAAIPVMMVPDGETACVRATVMRKSSPARLRRGMTLYRLQAADDTAAFTVTFFNNPYGFDAIREGEEYIFYGKFTSSYKKRDMASPIFMPVTDSVTMKPIYHLTAGLTNNMIASNMKNALSVLSDDVTDYISDEIREKYCLCHISKALNSIHFPLTKETLNEAHHRLAFEELLILQLALRQVKSQKTEKSGPAMNDCDMSDFITSLPFTLTGAQARAIDDVVKDMQDARVMNRLIQGDVGSGKTMVAAAGAYFAKKNGFQTALMAPTEILATQHYNTFTKTFENLGVRVMLLTGSMKQSEKKAVYSAILSGECDVLIGTHALISDAVEFKNLGLVITDEQHRFGVGQRAALSLKGNNPHTLVMSATPIPRTLSLIIYGDLDLSIIDELPPGRQEIKTVVINSKTLPRAYKFIKEQVALGRQAYVICPLIEEDEETGIDAKSVLQYSQMLQKVLPDVKIGTLHGKMKAAEKDEAMRAFASRETDVLVSTTVVEVGVDVPNATIILIENAERFGLSQLHQLRGRVGRGEFPSTCVLVCQNDTDGGLARLSVLKNTSDGFEIARQDMRLRGAGDLIGVRQHGLPKLKLADLRSDEGVIEAARAAALEMLSADPTLSLKENRYLARKVEKMLENVVNN